MQSEGLLRSAARRRVSILFSDIRTSRRSPRSDAPESLLRDLSESFEELASLIIKEGGTVDKYIGDAISRVLATPLPGHHQLRLALRRSACFALQRLNGRRVEQGLAPWHTRFGVHVGDAVLGNVGSSDRIDYTAIGDTVNIASRLEALNKVLW